MDDLTRAPASPGRVRLLIVDDDPLVRSGLALILGGGASLGVVAQAANGREGLDAVAAHRPDVVLMDIRMPVMDGIEATAALAAKHAPGCNLRIQVQGSPEDGVTVELRNPLGVRVGSTPGAGLGLVGLTERTELRGGRLEGRREEGTWVLRGWIPWAA